MNIDAFVELRNRLTALDPNFIVIRKTPSTLTALGPSNDGKIWFWDERYGRGLMVATVDSATQLHDRLDIWEKRSREFLYRLRHQPIRTMDFGIRQNRQDWFDKVFREAAIKICKEVKNDRAFFVTMEPGDFVTWTTVNDPLKEVELEFQSILSPDIENRFTRKTRSQTCGIIHMLKDLTFPQNDITFVFEKNEGPDNSLFLSVQYAMPGSGGVVRFNDATRI